MKRRKGDGAGPPPYPAPPGFRAVLANGRWTYSANESPIVLSWHESMIEELCEQYGLERASFPDSLECVRPHLRHRFLLKMDLADAYGHVKPFGAFTMLDLPGEYEEHWQYFFHRDGGLIQGAPASSIIFHFYVRVMVERDLLDLCRDLGLTWSRYVDDFLFSSNTFITPRTQKRLKHHFAACGFPINPRKTRAVDRRKETLVHLGVQFENHRVVLPDSFNQKLNIASQWGDQTYIRQLELWRNRVLALNDDA